MVKSLAINLITVYQKILSPDHATWRKGSAPVCRFQPTCSEYAKEAIEKHGVIRGTVLGLRRVSRCHPWGSHGYDPVPDHI
jgi:putative membrane protein insertion efficiency factor